MQFALLLALCRRVPDAVRQQAEGRWDRGLAAHARSLEGATLAIVGTGHIGIETARRAQAFGMRTVGLSRRAEAHALLDESLPLSRLHAALAQADAVVVAIASAPGTRQLIDASAFAACRRGALLVNAARGNVVDSAALVDALQSGQIGGAGLDVTDPEPLPAGDPLWRCPNVLVTPHVGGSGSAASIARLADGVAGNLRRLVAGEPLRGSVAAAASRVSTGR